MRFSPLRIAPALALVLAVGAVFVAPAHASDPRRLEQQWLLASRPGVKIRVREAGWYRVARPRLLAAGLDPRAPSSALRLFADGREVPFLVRRDGAIEFYGFARELPATNTRTYWLVAGEPGGRRIRVTRGGLRRAPLAPSFVDHIERKGRALYQAIKNGPVDNFFAGTITTKSLTQALTVPAIDRARVRALLEISIQGFSAGEHQTRIDLNGVEIGRARFAGRARVLIRVRVAPQRIVQGRNVVKLTAVGGDTDVSLLERIELTYARRFRATRDELTFSLPAGRRAVVSGFSSRRVRVADITSPDDPRLVRAAVRRGARGSFVTVPAARKARRLLAFSEHALRRPTAVVAERPSTWHRSDNGADLIIISHRDFLSSLEPLRALREQQGLKVALVDVEDLYDEFAYGVHGPSAIRAFLARAAVSWQPRPRFVLLVGDASYDPANYLGKGEQDFVPTKIIEAALIEAPSDDWFVDFDGNGVPELAIGRLPVQTPAQATAAVAKIVRYESGPAPADSRALLVADVGFEPASSELKATFPASTAVETSFVSEAPSADAFRARLLASLNSSPTVVSYIGHGAVQFWGAKEVFGVNDVPALTNARPSIFVMTTCLNGLFHDPGNESLGERLVETERGGAVAVWASSALSSAAEEIALGGEFFRVLFSDPTLRLGEVVVRTKANVPYDDARRTAILLGDPSTRVR